MIIKGSQRGGAKQLALHLLNDVDNDHVEIHAIEGFVSDNVTGALREIYAISRATKCKQFMFSLSLSPPHDAVVSNEDYEAAINDAAERLGLAGQPRIILFHEKQGRRHCHVVFSRINTQDMKGINLPFFKDRLNELSREIYLTHGWDVPKGFKDRKTSSKFNYNHVSYQEAKKAKRDPKAVKAILLECWQISDNRQSFEAALADKGFVLCRGDRRGFVVIDMNSKIYSLSRWIDQTSKTIRQKIGDPEYLPSVNEAVSAFAQNADINAPLNKEQNSDFAQKLTALQKEKSRLVLRQRKERMALEQTQQTRKRDKAIMRQKSLRKGLTGLWDRVTGLRHKQIEAIRLEQASDKITDDIEKLKLSSRHLAEVKSIQSRMDRLNARFEANLQANHSEIATNRASAITANTALSIEGKAAIAEVKRDPVHVLSIITDKKSVFTQDDIAKTLQKYIDEPQAYQSAMSVIMNAPELVALVPKQDSDQSRSSKTYYSTRSMIALENSLMVNAHAMAKNSNFSMRKKHVEHAIATQNQTLQKNIGVDLSHEQQSAIRHITNNKQISCVVGVAGAGKSTLLAAAKQAWEKQGYRVFGAALAGKAVKGLEQASGISSKTIAGCELSWRNDLHHLQSGDVLVVDEAGMIGTRQMAILIDEAKTQGAKIVLIGDPEQLQPINAGTPFKDILEDIGAARLNKVHRQKQEWQQRASEQFANGQIYEALSAYNDHGAISLLDSADEAINALVYDYMEDMVAHGQNHNRLALAHRREDVKAINQSIRNMRKHISHLQDENTYSTAHGTRQFADGDRLLFTKNDKDIGVKNGMLGTVISTSNRQLTVEMDDKDSQGNAQTVTFSIQDYNDIDHGYATTIHKSQGETVNKTFILASRSMDKNLTYVAMTRHKSETNLYAGKDEFKSEKKLFSFLARDNQRQTSSEFHAEFCRFDKLTSPLEIESQHS